MYYSVLRDLRVIAGACLICGDNAAKKQCARLRNIYISICERVNLAAIDICVIMFWVVS